MRSAAPFSSEATPIQSPPWRAQSVVPFLVGNQSPAIYSNSWKTESKVEVTSKSWQISCTQYIRERQPVATSWGQAMEKDELKKISKSMSYVLRHRPDTVGIELQENGWVHVDELLRAFERAGRPFTLEVLEQVVTENDKQRFEFSADRLKIRARQGHSVQVDL